jgi:hypothetical protein
VLVPWLAWRSRARLTEQRTVPRDKHLTAVLVQLTLFLVISLAVARIAHIPIWVRGAGRPLAWLDAALLVIAGVLLMRPRWEAKIRSRDPAVRLFMPTTRRQRALWLAVAAMAGISEEATYRGVLFALLWMVTGSGIAAALLAAVAFGVSHAVQGWRTAGIVTLIALLLHGLVAFSGTLYPAIVAHALYDMIAGLTYGRMGRASGYDEGTPPERFPEPLPAP